MRLAVLSDIHGNLIALEAALADLESVGSIDYLWVLGDLAAGGTRPAECVRRVAALKEAYGENKVAFIRGNTDRYLVRGERMREKVAEDEESFRRLAADFPERDLMLNWTLAQLSFDDYTFLSKLHGDTSLEAPGYGWVIGYHGTPGDDEGFLMPDTPDEEARDLLMDREGRLGIGGHIHVQMNRDLGNWRAVNAGSVGMSFEQPGVAQWGLFTFEGGDVHIDLRGVPYDVNALLADFATVQHPASEWTISKYRLT